jgi:hypothetical protein
VTDDARTRAAYEKLQHVLSAVASSMVDRVHERCPYRARDERCTFAGGCVNQRRAPDVVTCGGDHLLRRKAT